MRIVNSRLLCTHMKDFLKFMRELESKVGFLFVALVLFFCNREQRNFRGKPSITSQEKTFARSSSAHQLSWCLVEL